MLTPITTSFPGAFMLLVTGMSLLLIALHARITRQKKTCEDEADVLKVENSLPWVPEEKVSSIQTPGKKAA